MNTPDNTYWTTRDGRKILVFTSDLVGCDGGSQKQITVIIRKPSDN